MRSPLRLLLALIIAAALSGCGFHLRGAGSGNLPYKAMYIALPDTAAVFQQLSDNRLKSILSVNAQGRVSEYRLQLTYTFRIVNQKGQVLVPPNEVAITRDVSYDDSNILAKESEENLLWRDMTGDLVNQIMRRLSIIKPKNPDAEEDDE